MFTRCLACHVPFPANEVLERHPLGRRVAYDPERGRLWTVCGACRRWTLEPIEERWEALEELERAVVDRGRLLTSTDRIGLHRVDGLEVVRVGPAVTTAEEAWWRYGRSLVERRRKAILWGVGGAAVAGTLVVGGALAGAGALTLLNLGQIGFSALDLRRQRGRFGTVLWRGEAPCPRCAAVLRELRWEQKERVILVADSDDPERPFGVRIRCFRCGRRSPEAGYRLSGPEAEHHLRRILARHNARGGSESRVREAAGLVEEAGSARDLLVRMASEGVQLGELGRTGALALEIAANDDAERRMLRLEASVLEARWREEERLAAIVDGELTPWPEGTATPRSPGRPRAGRSGASRG